MIVPADKQMREARRSRMRMTIVAALTWSPTIPDQVMRRALACLAIVVVGLFVALHDHWIGQGWRVALDVTSGVASGLSGWWLAQTIRRRRSSHQAPPLDRTLFGPDV